MKRKLGSVVLTLALLLALFPAAAVPARAAEISGTINSDVSWNDGDVIPAAGVTITGSNNSEAPVTITVNGMVTVNGTITISSGYVKFTGGGTLLRGADYSANILFISGQSTAANVIWDGPVMDGNGVTAGTVSAAVRVSWGSDGQGATFTMSGGVIRNNVSESGGGGVTVNGGGTFYLNGGSITNNKADSYQTSWGAGVYVADGTFIMSGGSIDHNENTKEKGGGVYVSRGTFMMGGGMITDNTASGDGGGVYVNTGGAFVMNAGVIAGNTGQRGGGVYDYVSGGAFTMNGGVIARNTASSNYGPEVYGPDASPAASFTTAPHFRGGVVGTDYTNGTNVKVDAEGATEFPTCTISDVTYTIKNTNTLGSTVGEVGGENAATIVNVYGATAEGAVADVEGSRTNLYGCTVPGALTVNAGMNLYGCKVNGATTVNSTVNSIGSLYLYAGSAATHGYDNTKAAGVDRYVSDGATRYGSVLGSGDATRTTVSGGELIVYDGTLHGGVNVDNTDSGKLTLYGAADGSSGALVTGGSRTSDGGGVSLSNRDGNTLTMYGGAIVGNKSTGTDYGGGGVNIGTGSFVLYGGSISKNTAAGSGGGVRAASEQTFTMLGGVIDGNTAQNGGGVWNYGTFNIYGGSIAGNTTTNGGGGVYVYGTFTMYGGSIAGNSATYYGGGVNVIYPGAFVMYDGSITGNSARYGGGLRNANSNDNQGIFTMIGGSIAGNTATTEGGGIYNAGTFNLSGAADVSGNTANDVYLDYQKFITLPAALDARGEGKKIKVNKYGSSSSITITSGWNTYMSAATTSDYFTSAKDGYSIDKNSDGEVVLKQGSAEPTYTVTWKNYDGTVLETDTGVAAGTMPSYDSATPARAANASYTYAFSGWTPAVAAVAGDVTYMATYTATPINPPSHDDYEEPEPTYMVTAPVSGDANTVNVTVSVTGTAATLRSADIEKALDGNDETGTVEIDVSGLKRDVTSITIPAKTVSAISEAVADETNPTDSLTVKLTDGTVTFDAAAVAAIAEQAGGKDLRLNLDSIRATGLKAAQRTAVAELEVEAVYDAYMTAGGKRITDFKGGSATVTVTYALKEGQVGWGVVVWYVADDGEKTTVPTTYDDETVRFTIEHFSNYVVAYDETLAAACPQDDTCPIAAFTDTDPTAWYHDGFHYALDKGIMKGYGNGLFGPNDSTSRAMLVQILWTLEDRPVVDCALNFSDVDEGKWYVDAIRWAVAEEITLGYGGAEAGVFGVDDPITREQVAVILHRYAEKKGIDVTVGEDTDILGYDDAFEIHPWAIPAMQWTCGAGILEGKDDGSRLDPQGFTTRAELATMLMRFFAAVSQ